jgi:hypothetical protein
VVRVCVRECVCVCVRVRENVHAIAAQHGSLTLATLKCAYSLAGGVALAENDLRHNRLFVIVTGAFSGGRRCRLLLASCHLLLNLPSCHGWLLK